MSPNGKSIRKTGLNSIPFPREKKCSWRDKRTNVRSRTKFYPCNKKEVEVEIGEKAKTKQESKKKKCLREKKGQ